MTAARPAGKFCHGNGQVWHLPHVWSERGGKAAQKDENYPMLAPLCQQMCIVLGLDLIQQGGVCFLKRIQIFSTLGLFIATLLELGLSLMLVLINLWLLW